MPKNFLIFSSETPSDAQVSAAIESSPPEREALRILVIGSRRGVTGTIQTLHRLRYAEVREWSPLMPTSNPCEVMSILTRYILAY